MRKLSDMNPVEKQNHLRRIDNRWHCLKDDYCHLVEMEIYCHNRGSDELAKEYSTKQVELFKKMKVFAKRYDMTAELNQFFNL